MSLRRHVRLRNQAHRGRNRQRTGHPRPGPPSSVVASGCSESTSGTSAPCRLEAALIRNIGHQLVMLFGDVFLGNLIGSPLPRNVPCQRNGHAAIDVIDRRGLDWLACLGGCRIAHIRANVALDILRDRERPPRNPTRRPGLAPRRAPALPVWEPSASRSPSRLEVSVFSTSSPRRSLTLASRRANR